MVFAGEYEIVDRAQWCAELGALQFEPRNLIMDMSAVTFLDPTLLTEIIGLYQMRAARGYGRLTIVRVSLAVRKVFATFYLGTFCRIVDALDDALPEGWDNGHFSACMLRQWGSLSAVARVCIKGESSEGRLDPGRSERCRLSLESLPNRDFHYTDAHQLRVALSHGYELVTRAWRRHDRCRVTPILAARAFAR